MNLVEYFYTIKDPIDQQRWYLINVFNKHRSQQFHMDVKTYLRKQDNMNKRYYYLITFTLSDDNKDLDPKLIKKYIISRLAGSALQVEKAHLVQELTEQGRPHWHASVISKKYISRDRFKYYTDKFGFVDISKNHSQNYQTMIKYITKSNEPDQIIGGLLE